MSHKCSLLVLPKIGTKTGKARTIVSIPPCAQGAAVEYCTSLTTRRYTLQIGIGLQKFNSKYPGLVLVSPRVVKVSCFRVPARHLRGG